MTLNQEGPLLDNDMKYQSVKSPLLLFYHLLKKNKTRNTTKSEIAPSKNEAASTKSTNQNIKLSNFFLLPLSSFHFFLFFSFVVVVVVVVARKLL